MRRLSLLKFDIVTVLPLLILSDVIVAQHAGISIIPSGPAAGFAEDTSFNVTCTSNRQGNITWSLPNFSDELDNLHNKVLSNSN